MKIIPVKRLDNPDILKSLRQQQLLLWLLPGCTVEQLLPIMELPWITVWDDCPNLDFARLWTQKVNGKREPYVVERPNDDPPDIRTTEHLRIYRLHSQNRAASRKQVRYAERLRDKIEEYIAGIVTFVGSNINDDALDKLILTRELAPSLQITLITEDSIRSPTEGEGIAYQWADSSVDFLRAFNTLIADVDDPAILDLKEAQGVKVKPELLEDLSDYWTLLSHGLISPQKISQEEFDGFLEGKEIWASYASGVPYRRQEGCYFSNSEEPIDFIEEVINKIRDFEQTAKRPSEQIRQFLLLAEPGSGVTTLLRKTAVALAQMGYPTLMKKTFSQGFGGITLEKLIEDIQDKWLQQRNEKRARIGLLPVCLVLDTDAEIISSGASLARQLSGLGRPVVLIRAIERSRTELDKASNIYTLPATVTENELFAIGKHLRTFCQQHDLVSIPREAEWRAYYEGISRLSQFPSLKQYEDISVPPLFLIGIYPFIKERIRDKLSLERYYYDKWKALNNSNVQELIRVLAAASCYSIGIPYDVLRRHPDIDLEQIWMLDKETQRKVDTFIEWDIPQDKRVFSHKNWHLYIRHPAIGMLLSRMLDPLEGETPYSALQPLLERLITKEEDIWFAEILAVRLGGHFKTHSLKFSLETDTSLQKAARIIFKTIPAALKNESRTIRHHHGRYHIHVLHACTDALEHPNSTTLSSEMVLELAQDEYTLSKKELERALNISINALGEPDTYIYNTMATASFNLADALQHKNVTDFRKQFKSALEFQENAIITGPDNGHALFQFVNKALEILESGNKKWPVEEKEALFPLVESRLVELCTLHSEKRWRNIDPIDAEIRLGSIIAQHVKVSEQLVGHAEKFAHFKIKHPEAALLFKIRQVLKESTLKEVFRSPQAGELRQLREELKALPPKEARTYVYLYRLYVEDPIGRLNFAVRKGLLEKLYDLDYRQYLPFRHDEAALLCQLDSIKEGAEKFAELREANQSEYYVQWFWWHEKALLHHDDSGQLRKLVLMTHIPQPSTAYAYIRGTDISVIYKPRQFDKTFRKGEPFTAYIHFTRHGLQAVPENRAVDDLREMGLA